MDKSSLDEYKKFAKEKLNLEFANIDLLITALTHRSYVNEHKKTVVNHNERLEFLGDAVLELVVSDFLFHSYVPAQNHYPRRWWSSGHKGRWSDSHSTR